MADISITGISGRFPSSEDMDQFASNLFAGVDMVTADDIRWPKGTIAQHEWVKFKLIFDISQTDIFWADYMQSNPNCYMLLG